MHHMPRRDDVVEEATGKPNFWRAREVLLPFDQLMSKRSSPKKPWRIHSGVNRRIEELVMCFGWRSTLFIIIAVRSTAALLLVVSTPRERRFGPCHRSVLFCVWAFFSAVCALGKLLGKDQGSFDWLVDSILHWYLFGVE
jgi:hypothetical protein